MNAAIITGASAGLGLEFVSQLEDNFPEVDEVWLISRSEDKLKNAAALLKNAKAKIIPLDLCAEADIEKFSDIIKAENPDILCS